MLKQIKESPLLTFSILLYIVSLIVPATLNSQGEGMSGFGLLFSGALGLLYISGISSAINVTQFFGFLFSYLLPWFANVFFIIGLSAILWKKFTVSLVLSVLSTLVSIRVFFTGVPTTLMQSGTFDPSLSPPNFGFYLWFGSFILLAIYSLRQSLLQEKKV